jgi:hypothetical protein
MTRLEVGWAEAPNSVPGSPAIRSASPCRRAGAESRSRPAYGLSARNDPRDADIRQAMGESDFGRLLETRSS